MLRRLELIKAGVRRGDKSDVPKIMEGIMHAD
jgi:hypothetical protein